MIDVHAHLCYKDFGEDLDTVIQKSRQDLAGIIVSSARLEEGKRALELVRAHPGFLFASIGFHPTEGDDHRAVMDLIRENSGDIVAVGEVGLDYHWEKDPNKRASQKRVFMDFIRLAKELGKPLVIHSWDAERECFEMVRDAGIPVIFHCFSGKKDLALEIVNVPDFYVSISTQVLFNKQLRKIAKAIPMERLLLETDAPFLSPVKDKPNYPWNIIKSAEKIAKVRHVDSAEVLNAARENAISVFGLNLG